MLSLIKPDPILIPVVALVLWTLIMEMWMFAARLPAMTAAGLGPDDGKRASDLGKLLPGRAQSKADNYNHLMEQPTIFYAMALVLAVAGMGTGLNLVMAWIYVGSRVIHSLIQATVNKVMYRFTMFCIGSVALAVMAVNGAIQLF